MKTRFLHFLTAFVLAAALTGQAVIPAGAAEAKTTPVIEIFEGEDELITEESFDANTKFPSTIKLKSSKLTYTGKKLVPTFVVKDGEKTVGKSSYTLKAISGYDYKSVGTHKGKIVFKAPYSGTKTFTYHIIPKGTSISGFSTDKTAITVKYKKQSSQTTGYQIQYSASSSFSSSKSVTIKSTGTTSKKITGLSSGEKYYFRIRTYKTTGGKNYPSEWSKTFTSTTKTSGGGSGGGGSEEGSDIPDPGTNNLNVTYRSASEIKSYLQQHNVKNTYRDATYTTKPVLKAPYGAGVHTQQTKDDFLTAINAIRYVAGLNDVTLDENYNRLAMAGALINCANGVLSHSPSTPSGMSSSLAELGKQGAGSSNIAMGSGASVPGNAVIDLWMNDGDAGNRDRIGHRRWVLNPSMGKTGFGTAGSFSAMYSFDRSGSGTQTQVAWPAQNTPIELYSTKWWVSPWSISMGSAVSSAKVKLVRTKDKKTWNFPGDGYFNINNASYGLSGCIIFVPDGLTPKAGESYTVTVDYDGKTLTYGVNFFKAY